MTAIFIRRRKPKREHCEICQQLPEEGDGRYECMKCERIVCSGCSRNAGEDGNDVLCDECYNAMTDADREQAGVIEDGE